MAVSFSRVIDNLGKGGIVVPARNKENKRTHRWIQRKYVIILPLRGNGHDTKSEKKKNKKKIETKIKNENESFFFQMHLRRLFSAGFRASPSQAPTLISMGTRRIFSEEHDQIRETARKFFASEVTGARHTFFFFLLFFTFFFIDRIVHNK